MPFGKLGNMNFEDTFKGKKVFLTGHTGFKGSWLLAWLHLLGAQIKGYALAPENDYDLYHQINGDQLCESIIADIRDLEKLKSELLNFEPDFVFHLAAQPLVIKSYEQPLYTYEVNVIGTANILEALKELAKPCIAVMITTDKVYRNLENGQAYQETDALGGYDPYSASKAAAEIIINSYRQSFFNPLKYQEHQKSVASARAGNVIGGGDWAKDRIVPDIVRALQNEQEILVRNPDAVRPWQHVLEPLSGYLRLAQKQSENPVKYAEVYNFGPELSDNLTVKELVNMAIKVWGNGKANFAKENNGHHEAKLLQLNIDKVKKDLNWHPKMEAKKAIDLTIKLYKNILEHPDDIHSFIIKSIKNFL
jgi:CDP-glucose 4,6-dehydratase